MKKNEENACNAFIEILQKIKGVEYKQDTFPEKENRNTPDVEVILIPKDKDRQFPKIAVEHTIIEAHKEQIAYVHQLNGIDKEIDQKCQGKLPIDYYFGLIAPPSLIVGMNKKNRDQFVEEMSGWIPNVAKSLTTDQQSSQLYNEHEVSLWCVGSCSEENKKIGMMSTRPENAKKERQDRFRWAIEKKSPKLIKYSTVVSFTSGNLLVKASFLVFYLLFSN